jgi:hypothetical protein
VTITPPSSERPAASAAPSGDTPSERRAASASFGELFGEVTKDMSVLVRQEIALAKAEITESASRAGKGAGLLGGAGYAGLMAILFLSIALWWGLGYLVGNAWSAVIVAVIWAIVALILMSIGRKKLKEVRGAPRTAETLKKIPEALKRNEENK